MLSSWVKTSIWGKGIAKYLFFRRVFPEIGKTFFWSCICSQVFNEFTNKKGWQMEALLLGLIKNVIACHCVTLLLAFDQILLCCATYQKLHLSSCVLLRWLGWSSSRNGHGSSSGGRWVGWHKVADVHSSWCTHLSLSGHLWTNAAYSTLLSIAQAIGECSEGGGRE